jgi:adenine-specific DNA-methyltransferase
MSIDDNEIDNLRKISDEVFGEENFIANCIWQHSLQPKAYENRVS